MEVTAQASYLGKGFQVQNDAGHHTFISDRMRQVGGTDLGPDSLQLLLASFATSLCSSAVAIAKEREIVLQHLTVVVEGLIYPEYNEKKAFSPFNQIHFHIHLKSNLTPAEKEEFLQAAQKNSIVYQILQNPTQLYFHEEDSLFAKKIIQDIRKAR